MTERIDLNDEINLQLIAFAQLDETIENRLPILVPCEVVVGYEEAMDALRHICAHYSLAVICRAKARLAALHVDDRAERALIGTTAPSIQTGIRARGPQDALRREQRHRRALQVRQIVHEIVERLDILVRCIAQHLR